MKTMAENFTPEEWKRLKGVSNGGYHYLGAAKILAPIGKAFAEAVVSASGAEKEPANSPEKPVLAEMAGYLLVPHEKVDAKYNAGFSMYVAAWPLLKNYPGQEFQSGLFGTWMFAQYDGPKPPKKHYSDIEGGLGWWRDTRFATETPKFIMGGVALNFSEWANGPGAGKGRDWKKPAGHYAVAQLSPWVLWPPDGLNLKQGTCGELFGYGYLPLPLTAPKKTTAGKDVPTGNHCWTLFLNTGNFKGPVAFFLPYFWSKPSVENPKLAGLFLDTRPSEPNKAVQMETQHIPAYIGQGREGRHLRPHRPDAVPGKRGRRRAAGASHHRVQQGRAVGRRAGVVRRREGGVRRDRPEGRRPSTPSTARAGRPGRSIRPNDRTRQEGAARLEFVRHPRRPRRHHLRLQVGQRRTVDEGRGARHPARVLPPGEGQEGQGAVGGGERQGRAGRDRPGEGGVPEAAQPPSPKPYVTPDEADSCWKKPGPAAGPFEAKLGDGSVVTYYWYRFADQPALLNADLTDGERESLQKRVEMLHKKLDQGPRLPAAPDGRQARGPRSRP